MFKNKKHLLRSRLINKKNHSCVYQLFVDYKVYNNLYYAISIILNIFTLCLKLNNYKYVIINPCDVIYIYIWILMTGNYLNLKVMILKKNNYDVYKLKFKWKLFEHFEIPINAVQRNRVNQIFSFSLLKII